MNLGEDLAKPVLAPVLGDRELRSYPALLSTHAEALAWARAGGAEGSVVVADYQASPRGRAGIEWKLKEGVDLGFSVILRPKWPPAREGWLYTVTTLGISDVFDGASIRWPDEVLAGEEIKAKVGAHAELGPGSIQWAVVTVLVKQVAPERPVYLKAVIEAVEARYRATEEEVLSDYLERCITLGLRVRARLIPMGPAGPVVEGEAVGSVPDGALVVLTEKGRRVAVRPQHLGLLEES
jgi:BirA family biotin operon repressor/biotin-[acetyl-CoA-carboxylase] ligase